MFEENLTINEVASEFELHPKTVQLWKKQFLENAVLAFDKSSVVKEYKEEIEKLQKEKDKQMAKKWCGDFDKIAENLKKQGINLNKEMVKEPNEIEIRYEVVESKISNQNYKLEHYNTNIKENKQ